MPVSTKAAPKLRRVADAGSVKAATVRLAEIRQQLADARAKLETLKSSRTDNEVEGIAQSVVAGQDPVAVAAAGRNQIAEAEQLVAGLVRAVEIQQEVVNRATTAVIREIQAEQRGELHARLAAVAAAVCEVGNALEELGQFTEQVTDCGAGFSETAWRCVLGHVNDRTILTLPVPAVARRAIGCYLNVLKNSFPDMADDLQPLIADWS